MEKNKQKHYPGFRSFLVAILVCSFIAGCKKDDEPDDPGNVGTIPELEVATGMVKLPEGAPLGADMLTIVSANESSSTMDGAYSISVPGYYTTVMATNAQEEIVLMSYLYPGSENFDISTESTALAMLMNTPAALMLEDDGKLDLINEIVSNPNFSNLVAQIEQAVNANATLLDSTNVDLMTSIAGLFENLGGRGSSTGTVPVSMTLSSNSLIFNNSGVSISTLVSIYGENSSTPLENLIIRGNHVTPSSLGAILGGNFGAAASTSVQNHPQYSFGAEGTYQVRLRTGLPGSGGSGSEHNMALYENLSLFATKMLLAISGAIRTSGFSCWNITQDNTKTLLMNHWYDFSAVDDPDQALYEALLVSMENLGVNMNIEPPWCNGVTWHQNHFQLHDTWWQFLSKVMTQVQPQIGKSPMSVQWQHYVSSVDTCVSKTPSELVFCIPEGSNTDSLNAGEVLNPATGRIWMDRNLGASQVATSFNDAAAYGDYYQWGRATTDFTIVEDPPFDWSVPQNDNYWQGVNGLNNPCPLGFRVPTEAEWNEERLSWSSNNMAGAFASPLKLTAAGGRSYYNGSLSNVGSHGSYWSSTLSVNTLPHSLFFGSSAALLYDSGYRAMGMSVRCIKD